MTKKLNWKLKTLPTAADIASLVEQKVITADEGREILFNSKEFDAEQQNKALKEQIEFMERTIENLIKQMGSGFSFRAYTYQPRTPIGLWWGTSGGMVTNAATNTVSYAPGQPNIN